MSTDAIKVFPSLVVEARAQYITRLVADLRTSHLLGAGQFDKDSYQGTASARQKPSDETCF
jgi:hypothetical protein